MVLLYHRIARLPEDPHLLCVTPEHFEEQLLALMRFCKVVSLSQMTKDLAKGKRLGPVVALTFDDGYADNAEVAMPLLKKYGIPSTFYLASGFVGTTREYLQDDLERLLLLAAFCPDPLRITVGRESFAWSMQRSDYETRAAAPIAGWNMLSASDPTPLHRAHREIHNLLRAVNPVEREEVLTQLRQLCGDPGQARITHSAMTWEQARQMASCDLIEIGAHTVNHAFLSALTQREQREEILDSKRTLEEKIGLTVSSFAYPYGTRQSYNNETIQILNKLGFLNACSNFRARIGPKTDSFQIPRFVVRDWDAHEFIRMICSARM